MSVSYQAVLWNRQKRKYDLVIGGGTLLYLAVFIGGSFALYPDITFETALIRGAGTLAFLLLHVVLSIGPLARLDQRFLPLLYNRRHLGVATFLVGSIHGALSLFQFHVLGPLNPFVSLFLSNTHYDSLSDFPFQTLGFLALGILFLMAATSHDFWLANLTAPVWKTLHMAVYLAYGLLVMHVALGVLQAETNPVYVFFLALGATWVLGLHLVAGFRERRADSDRLGAARDEFIEVCSVDDIAEDRARIVCLSGERVAVFKYDGKISAVSNVCQHQNGPLGEGKVVDGCITCPWHGYQYLPETGTSPPPFQEKIPTFNVRVREGRVLVHPSPNQPGMRAEPASVNG